MGDNLNEIFSGLNEEEKRALNYFLNNISVGEILAVRELKVLEGISDPERILDSLVSKGLIERGRGCYNLSPKLRALLKKK